MKAEELLAVMQHHDCITATSKTHIERMFKDRMRNMTTQLIQSMKNMNSYEEESIVCRLYE